MKIYQEMFDVDDLIDYLLKNSWSGARDRIEDLQKDGKLRDACECFLSIYGDDPEYWSETELNDFWWFESDDFIKEYCQDEEEITENKKQQKDIKTWYMKEYPDDELGEEIRPNLTSIEIFNLMKKGKDIYEILGGDSIDSIIRERVFEKMSDDLNIDYDVIYNLWLNN